MDFVYEGDKIVSSFSYKIFGIGRDSIIKAYNNAIFHLTVSSNYDEVVNVLRKLISIQPENTFNLLLKIRKIKPKDISVSEEIIRYCIENNIDPFHHYMHIARELKSVEYYEKAYKFAEEEFKSIIERQIHEINPAYVLNNKL